MMRPRRRALDEKKFKKSHMTQGSKCKRANQMQQRLQSLHHQQKQHRTSFPWPSPMCSTLRTGDRRKRRLHSRPVARLDGRDLAEVLGVQLLQVRVVRGHGPDRGLHARDGVEDLRLHGGDGGGRRAGGGGGRGGRGLALHHGARRGIRRVCGEREDGDGVGGRVAVEAKGRVVVWAQGVGGERRPVLVLACRMDVGLVDCGFGGLVRLTGWR